MPRQFALIHVSPTRASYLQHGTRGVTARVSGSWRAVSKGSLGQGWQSSFMIPKLFKRPHTRPPSILKGKWLFTDRQGGNKAGIGSVDPS